MRPQTLSADCGFRLKAFLFFSNSSLLNEFYVSIVSRRILRGGGGGGGTLSSLKAIILL